MLPIDSSCDLIFLLFNFKVPTETKKDMHSRRQEDEDIRVQEFDAQSPAGDEAAMVSRRRKRAGFPAPCTSLPRTFQFLATPQRRQLHEPWVLSTTIAQGG